jgi:MFS family permease
MARSAFRLGHRVNGSGALPVGGDPQMNGRGRSGAASGGVDPDRYKWIALSNTTLGILMATINMSILLIALPDIFKGLRMNPLVPGNVSYLLWLILGFMVVTAVLVVSLGRLGDMYGRVKMYNLGFLIFTVFSILLAVDWMYGGAGALWLIGMRIGQGIGGAFLFANSSAILTDAFPENERGLALGINNVAGIAGSFLGLILGGLLGPVEWRLVFVVSIPIGVFGTVWSYLKLRDTGARTAARIDWWGNLTFAVGLIAVLVGITYGIIPYGGHTMGWTSPFVLSMLFGGIVVLGIFGYIETKVASPMFHLNLFRIRAFTGGNFASLLAGLGRGGMMFLLIIWLQGIWLPEHGYAFGNTPLWAGIYMLPMTAGFLLAGPGSGYLSDHFGARPFATGGMLLAALSFGLLTLVPVDFSYIWFALLLLMNGLGMGLFSAPNRAGIMNSLPPQQRGAGAGMVATFQNSAMVLSIGVFFTLIITGMASTLPKAMYSGLVAHGVPRAAALSASKLPPTSTVFSALLGYNPMKTILGPTLPHLSPATVTYLTGRSFFPKLISRPFGNGIKEALFFGMAALLLAAVASWLRGGKYHYVEGAEMAGVSDGSEAGPSSVQPAADRSSSPAP